MDSIARWMRSGISLGACCPNGSLGIVDVALIDISVKKVIIERRSKREWRGFGFTCGCVRMQWVPHYWHIAHTCSSILWYIPSQDWTRFSTSLFNLSIYSTPADCCAHPNAAKKIEDPRKPQEKIHLLAPKPQEQCINLSCWVAGRKYQKLYRYSKRIFSRNGAISILTASFWANVKSWFLGGWLRFATDMHPNSITRPNRCSMVTSERPFTSSIIAYRPFRRRRHISLQL